MPLFQKIVAEAATIPLMEEFCLTGLGEPLLDKDIIERIKYIREHLAAVPITLYTNGTYLTNEKAVALRDAGLSTLYVSLNAVNREKRFQIMKLSDYDQVEQQTKDAIAIGGDRMKVIVKAVCSKDLMEHGEADTFLDTWGGDFTTGGHAFLHLEGNWAGGMWPMRVKPTTPCSRALNQIMVLWDGRVSLCCFDGDGEVIFGDLNRQTIREVFAGEAATSYRRAHSEGRRGELKLCATCTAI